MKIGDYYQLVSVAGGAYLAFSATFNGEQDVYLLRLGMPPCTSETPAAERAASTALPEHGDELSHRRGRGRTPETETVAIADKRD
jgi:hypothetical protein